MSDLFNPNDFHEESQPNIESQLQEQRDFNTHFDTAKLGDLNSRKTLRFWVSGSIGIIMLIQMAALYYFIHLAFEKNNITELKWLFVTLFGGTLAETYLLARLIVTWLFKDIPYKPDCEKIEK